LDLRAVIPGYSETTFFLKFVKKWVIFSWINLLLVLSIAGALRLFLISTRHFLNDMPRRKNLTLG
jgi:hypothetical protein